MRRTSLATPGAPRFSGAGRNETTSPRVAFFKPRNNEHRGNKEETRMRVTEHKDFAHPDEVRKFEKGRAEILNTTGGVVGRLILEPGWRWSKHVKPIAGTELCQAPHFQYHIAGTLHIVMADGTEFDAGPGA